MTAVKRSLFFPQRVEGVLAPANGALQRIFFEYEFQRWLRGAPNDSQKRRMVFTLHPPNAITDADRICVDPFRFCTSLEAYNQYWSTLRLPTRSELLTDSDLPDDVIARLGMGSTREELANFRATAGKRDQPSSPSPQHSETDASEIARWVQAREKLISGSESLSPSPSPRSSQSPSPSSPSSSPGAKKSENRSKFPKPSDPISDPPLQLNDDGGHDLNIQIDSSTSALKDIDSKTLTLSNKRDEENRVRNARRVWLVLIMALIRDHRTYCFSREARWAQQLEIQRVEETQGGNDQDGEASADQLRLEEIERFVQRPNSRCTEADLF